MTVGITELPPEGMQLGGVALAGDSERGTKTTEGLSLLFTSAGITVQGPAPQIERLLVWSGLDSAACNEKIELSDGRSASVMELTSGGQSIRFLLPTETVSPGQAAYLDQALPAWLARYRSMGTQTTSTASTGSAVMDAAEDGGSSAPTGAGIGPSDATAASGAPAAAHDASATPRMSPAAAAGTAAAAAAAGGAAAAATGSTNGSADDTGEATPVSPPPPAGTGLPPSPVQPSAPPPPAQASAPPPPQASAPPAPAHPSAPPQPSAPPPPAQANLPQQPTAPPPHAPAGPPPPPPPPPPPNVVGRAAPPVGVVGGSLPPSGFEPVETGPPTQSWDRLGDSSPQPTAWDDPPLGQAPPPSQQKKRRWKRSRSAAEEAAPAAIFAAATPPLEPPDQPVPLGMSLPPPPVKEGPPPAARGAFRWRPQSRDKSKQEPELQSTDAPESFPPELPPEPVHPDPASQPAAFAPTEHESATGLPTGPGDVVVLSAAAAKKKRRGERKAESPHERRPAKPAKQPSAPRRRQLTALLIVALLLVIGGIAYFLVKKNNNTTTTASSPPVTSAVAADTALAASINLRLTDLPSGWARVAPTVPSVRPLAAPLQAQRTADTALAGCLGVPVQTTSGLFGGAAPTTEVATATSPTFQDASATGFQMHSTSSVMASAAQVQALATPFASTSFVPCYAQHQSAIVAAAAPGSVAQLEVVSLPAPAGVKAYGYLTSITTATGGKEVVGQAFIFGGRISALLEPTTDGPPVPSSAFVPAYNSMVARVAAASSR
jgi:hypothetical protein